MTGESLAGAQDIPLRFLKAILGDLRRAGLLSSQRGADGGFRLARPADAISVADAIRAVEGPLADVRGVRPPDLEYVGAAAPLREVWVAARAALRGVLDEVSLADVAGGQLPAAISGLLAEPGVWE